jgi:hypothetical protein
MTASSVRGYTRYWAIRVQCIVGIDVKGGASVCFGKELGMLSNEFSFARLKLALEATVKVQVVLHQHRDTS